VHFSPPPSPLPPLRPRRSISFRLLTFYARRAEGGGRAKKDKRERKNRPKERSPGDKYSKRATTIFLFNNIYNMVVRSTLAGDEQTIIFLEKSVQLTTVETRKINIKKI